MRNLRNIAWLKNPGERLGRRVTFDAEQNPVMLGRLLLLRTHFKEYRSTLLSTLEECRRVSITILYNFVI